MINSDSHLDSANSSDFADKLLPSAYNTLLMLTKITVAACLALTIAESNNQLNYESRFARIVAGCLKLAMNTLHTTNGAFDINPDARLITAGPHRSGLDAIIIGLAMKGTPPQFLATNKYNSIPGISHFMTMFKAITIDSTKKGEALEAASKALQDQGRVALFPQGGFQKLGHDPRMIYNGAARLALEHKIPIEVIRLDGFWSLQNPLIPLSVRNNDYYRALFSAFHVNNVRPTWCATIDFHLNPDNDNLSDEQKIEEINAQIYAYYRDVQELTVKQIDMIREDISAKTHIPIWCNKVKQEALQKEILNLKKEESETITVNVSDKTHLLLWQNKVEQGELQQKLLNLKQEGAQLEATTLFSMDKSA